MRAVVLGLVVTFTVGAAAEAGGSHSVRGYTRKDGTYVQPHMQTNPNGTRADNWSTVGNVNPYTGQPGTKPLYPTAPILPAPTTAYRAAASPPPGLVAKPAVATSEPQAVSAIQDKGWVQVSRNAYVQAYVRTARAPNQVWVRMESLTMDRLTQGGKAFASSAMLYQIDCAAGRFKELSATLYAGNNLEGVGQDAAPGLTWAYAVPDSIADQVIGVACGAPRGG